MTRHDKKRGRNLISHPETNSTVGVSDCVWVCCAVLVLRQLLRNPIKLLLGTGPKGVCDRVCAGFTRKSTSVALVELGVRPNFISLRTTHRFANDFSTPLFSPVAYLFSAPGLKHLRSRRKDAEGNHWRFLSTRMFGDAYTCILSFHLFWTFILHHVLGRIVGMQLRWQ